MTALVGYFDAAGHPDGKHALTVGGYVSSVPRWLHFEKEWKRALKPAGIEVLHMAAFMACAGDFTNWTRREDEQYRLLLKLSSIIKKHVRHSFSTMVLLDDWETVNQSYALKENHCTPYGLCGFFTMHKVMKWLLNRTANTQVRFVFEDGDKHKGDFMWMMDRLYVINKRELAGIRPTFEPKTLAPLQAADFTMWEQLNLAKDRIRNPVTPAAVRKTLSQLMTVPNTWGVTDTEKLMKFCVDFAVPRRGEHVGVTWSPFRSSPRTARVEGQR